MKIVELSMNDLQIILQNFFFGINDLVSNQLVFNVWREREKKKKETVKSFLVFLFCLLTILIMARSFFFLLHSSSEKQSVFDINRYKELY